MVRPERTETPNVRTSVKIQEKGNERRPSNNGSLEVFPHTRNWKGLGHRLGSTGEET